MNKDFIVFGAPDIQQAEIKEIIATMKSGWLGTGPKVAEFEKSFAEYRSSTAKHAAAVNSCTAALHISMIAAGIKPGDEVITTPLTFCATVNSIIHAGAMPVLADVNPQTMNIDPVEIAKKITSKTRAVIPVHFAGLPCDMDPIMALAEKHKLKVIEDCAHAIETEYHGKSVGTFGDFGCFSFYVTKNIVTGEGGMVIAKNAIDIDRIKRLALHGMSKDAWHRFSDSGYKHYQVVECGFKYNMMDLQAAIGIHQLSRIDESWCRRREIWRQYQQAFCELPITIPVEVEKGSKHGYHLYTIQIDAKRAGISRDEFLDVMTRNNIGVGVHYLSLPEHPYYQKEFGWIPEQYPHAMAVGRTTVSLPISPKLKQVDLDRIIAATKSAIKLI